MRIETGRIPKGIKLVIYGEEGVGKSTLASQLPGAVFIDTEGSTAHMDVRRLPAPQSWAELMDEVRWCISNPAQVGTLVIDTADWAERMCLAAVCSKAGKTGIEDFGYGKGYTYNAEEFGKFLNELSRLIDMGVNICFTAHAQMRKFEKPEESGAFDRWELKLSKQCSPMLKEWADAVLFAQFETVVVQTKDGKTKGTQGTKRVMHTTHHACWDAKNRFGLADKLPFEYGSIAQLFPPVVTSKFPHKPGKRVEPEPIVKAAETPVPPPAPAPKEEPAPSLPPSVPPALARLMAESDVKLEEIMYVISQRGYFPAGTQFENLPKDFIDGVLIAAWDQVRSAIIENKKKIPF